MLHSTIRNVGYLIKSFIKDVFQYQSMLFEEVDYDEYWKSKKKKHSLGKCNSFQLERAKWISSRIKDDATIADIGCGDGAVLLEISKCKDIKKIGIDLSSYTASFLSGKGVAVIEKDIYDINFEEDLLSIDYILMLEVLEHVQNPEDFVHKALSAANDSIFISFPNTGYIKHRLRLLFGRFPVQWRVHPGEHLRFWTLRDLEWWLGQLKLKDKSTIHSYEGVPILNKIYSGMFSAAFIVEIKK